MLEIKIDNISMIPKEWNKYIVVMSEEMNYYLDLGPGTASDSRMLADIYEDCPTIFVWEE